ncbi:hypothetical protein [Clostridium coskatii]|uniref:Uncharacterized protein n=1 Tax=Clostridium coskatii TaxID=1705578 RepID=A0A162LFE0_9CLOT|nr:hypothetical protein [Clostridium coskatii]OAA95102.1 hypothetical protein WX73_01511 [Clostridium coskatii]OBR97550.1 hypothetical protein CLCOS_02650 [Clostridium coskatii]
MISIDEKSTIKTIKNYFCKFVQKIQKNKINEEVLEAINSLICSDEAS